MIDGDGESNAEITIFSLSHYLRDWIDWKEACCCRSEGMIGLMELGGGNGIAACSPAHIRVFDLRLWCDEQENVSESHQML